MKRPSWIIVATVTIAVIAIVAGACGGGGRSINVDASYSGQQVEISVGDSLIITLPSDIRTGYIWTAIISDDRILHKIDNKYVGQVGVGGKVSMKYIQPDEEDVPPLNTFFLTVVVN
jgi:hypothetical protein